MSTPIKPALEGLDEAISHLETVVEAHLSKQAALSPQQEMNFGMKEDGKIDQMIAAKLDSTINRLETLLNEE